MMSLAPAQPGEPILLDPDGALRGRARAVPFAPEAAHFAVLAQGAAGAHVALVEAGACKVEPGRNLAGDSQGTLIFEGARALAHAPADVDAAALALMGCIARAVQSAGALAALLELALRYAGERVAFERPIGRFQAVQHNLARLAGEASVALAASASAADAIERAGRLVERAGHFDEGVFLEAAAAKIRCAEAAHEGAAIAHQVFGAIGYSQEHILHRFTLRLLAWREDFGNESLWAAELGRRVAQHGADELWPLIAAR
jgi:acyl-CoA dehydrogenase